MTASDVAYLVGELFGAYAVGFASGYLLYAFKRASDFI